MTRLLAFYKHYIPRLCNGAEPVTYGIESFILGAFFSSIALSFAGLLNQPLVVVAVLALFSWGFYRLSRQTKVEAHPVEPAKYKTYYYVIGTFIFLLVFLSFFMMPTSSDGLRSKLVRMALGANGGSLWHTSSLEDLSVIYYIPAPFYAIFSFVESLRLPMTFYAVLNTILMLGSALNLFILLGKKRSIANFFLIIIFISAPQFLFAGWEEHEDALTFFLSTSAAVWLIAKPANLRSLIYAIFFSALAIATKYSTAVFLPFALLILLLYFADKQRLRWCFSPRTLFASAVISPVVLLIVLIPDLMVDYSRGITFFEQLARLGKYHMTVPASCGPYQFALRLFEFYYDTISIWTNFFKINLTPIMPDFTFMPKGCAVEDTSLYVYSTPQALTRVGTQYGFLPILVLVGLFITKGRARKIALAAFGLFLCAVAIYSVSFTYWSGTGRYFMVGVLILFPAVLLSFEALQQRLKPAGYLLVAFIVLLPALFIFLRLADNVPRTVLRGHRIAYLIRDMMPTLHNLHGKVNVYYNDILPFYVFVRSIPSRDVTFKKEFIEGATNIISVPNFYNGATNWHDSYYLVPVPASKGEFVALSSMLNGFGNYVPVTYFITKNDQVKIEGRRYNIKPLNPNENVPKWVESLGANYRYQSARHEGKNYYFISEKGSNSNEGICLRQSANEVAWLSNTINECKVEKAQ